MQIILLQLLLTSIIGLKLESESETIAHKLAEGVKKVKETIGDDLEKAIDTSKQFLEKNPGLKTLASLKASELKTIAEEKTMKLVGRNTAVTPLHVYIAIIGFPIFLLSVF